jgi:ribose 5-phosphate isomerase B
MKKVFLASDHAGYELKVAIQNFLSQRGFETEDLGPDTYVADDDYPDYLFRLGRKVSETKGTFGLGFGGSGQGEAMAANRIKGARAAEYYGGNDEIIKLSRQHNDANILCIGARFVSREEAEEVVINWLTTDFSGEERHARRIAKLDSQ